MENLNHDTIKLYFLKCLKGDYYKKGYKPVQHIPLLGSDYLLNLLKNDEGLQTFKNLRGYVGDLSLEDYESFLKHNKQKTQQVDKGSNKTCKSLYKGDVIFYFWLIILSPVFLLILLKTAGVVIVLVGGASLITTPYLLLFLVSDKNDKDLWKWFVISATCTVLFVLFVFILNSTGLGGYWKDVIQACGRYC